MGHRPLQETLSDLSFEALVDDSRIPRRYRVGSMSKLLSYVAQTEREFIRQRQKEGIAAAKSRGVKFGHPPLQRSERFYQLKSQWQKGEISSRVAARELNVAHSTFVRWSKEKQA